jgi:4-amino-4-deoxy-L-arabinose transferase-like glycosyltransferase
MTNQPNINLLLNQLKAAFNKWRLAFLVFALAYAIILLLNLTNHPMEWDEVNHLNGALFLNYGLYDKFVSSSFYPPLINVVILVFFKLFGTSLFSARLVPAVFSILTLFAVFELAYSMYGKKVALLSAVLLGVMPGYFWLSRLALLEALLVFFITVALLFFYRWLQTRQDRLLVFSGLAVGLGFLTKYQMIITGLIIAFCIVFLARGQLKRAFTRFTLLVVTALLVVIPWIVIAYQIYASKIFSQWIYALQIGNPERLLYSDRYPTPIFYLIDMVWPYSNVHPISIFLYIFGFLGLGVLVWRHNKADKFILIWFVCIYVFFSFIDNKTWRYVMPLFPALAISTAVFISFLYGKLDGFWKRHVKVNKKYASKLFAGLFIVLIAGAIVYSINDAYSGVAFYNIQIDIEGATNYAVNHLNGNESIMVLCPFNFFSQEMVNFYLWEDGENHILTYQYPVMPVDTYTPNFNITELISECKQNNVKYVFTYEYGGTVPYFNTTLNLQQIYEQLYNSGNFSKISDEATFGSNPRRIFILNFTG